MSGDATRDPSALAERLVVDLGAAFQQRAVYPSAHPQVHRAVERTIAAFEAWLQGAESDELSLLSLEGQLLVDHQALPEEVTWTRGLMQGFARHGIGGLVLLRGLDAAELGGFLDSCASAAGPQGSAHLQVGKAGLLGGDAHEEASGGSSDRPPFASPEQLLAARQELIGIARGTATRVERLRAMIGRLARAAQGLRLEPPHLEVADSDDRAFVHGLAVALASLRLGQALGLSGDALDELGMAGLLHDVGHLEPAPPGEDAALRRRLHPARGAARLAALDGVPEVAVLAAYEHHLRFDGQPNYPRLDTPRLPVAVARIVAVADSWDTVRSIGGATAEEALQILRDRAGTFLDPALVELFAALVRPEPLAAGS